MLNTQNCLQNHVKNAIKQPNFFYSQLSTLPKEALAKFYLSTTLGLSFMTSSVWILPDHKLVFPVIAVCTHAQKGIFVERNSDTVT